MDWKSFGDIVGPILINNAPTIGGVLGGFIPLTGGSLIGETMGKILADQFGVPPGDPNVLANAIQNDPNAAAKISAAEAEATAKWPALAEIAKANAESNAKQSGEINATMRAELARGFPWWAWRNLYGYSVAMEATATSWVILYALVIEPKLFSNVSGALPFFLSWYGLRFGLLGYIHNQGTQEKIAAATGQQPEGIVKTIVKAVKGK